MRNSDWVPFPAPGGPKSAMLSIDVGLQAVYWVVFVTQDRK